MSINCDEFASISGTGMCDHEILLTKNCKNRPNLSKLESFMIYFKKYITSANSTFHLFSVAEKSFSPSLASFFEFESAYQTFFWSIYVQLKTVIAVKFCSRMPFLMATCKSQGRPGLFFWDTISPNKRISKTFSKYYVTCCSSTIKGVHIFVGLHTLALLSERD